MPAYLKKNRCFEDKFSYKATGILVLEDETFFYGQLLSNFSHIEGEVCFNTGMTGYQEVISDPSYANQIVAFSFPHIGNVGTNESDEESSTIALSGIIIGELPTEPSNFRATSSLIDYLISKKVGGLHSVDTRSLIKKIVNSPTPLKGKIQATQKQLLPSEIKQLAILASKIKGLSGNNLTKSTEIHNFSSGKNNPWVEQKKVPLKYKVAVLDFGIKENILRSLYSHGVQCEVFQQDISYKKLIKEDIRGVVLSNGPGDPCAIGKQVMETIESLLESNIPILAICLGYQLLALVSGGNVKQLTCGHHGINHPVKNLATNEICITSQNHEFVVDENSLPQNIIPTYRSLFDGTLEGFTIMNKPVIAVQFHPEASPGPHDTKYIFNEFVKLMDSYAQKN